MTLRRKIRQLLCRHDWSCRWSRRCTGDHRCVKCGWAPAKAPGIYGEGLGTGLPNDGDYSDTELRALKFLQTSDWRLTTIKDDE